MKLFQMALVAVAATSAFTASAFAQDAPRKAFVVMQEACGSCHGLNRLETSKNRADWKDTVDRMMGNGADVKANEVNALVGYLVKFYGESVEMNKASQKELQDELDMSATDAEAIVKTRSESGNFKAYADLAKVPGLDMKKLDPIKDRLRF